MDQRIAALNTLDEPTSSDKPKAEIVPLLKDLLERFKDKNKSNAEIKTALKRLTADHVIMNEIREAKTTTIEKILGALMILQKGYVEGLATKPDLEKLRIKLEKLEQGFRATSIHQLLEEEVRQGCRVNNTAVGVLYSLDGHIRIQQLYL